MFGFTVTLPFTGSVPPEAPNPVRMTEVAPDVVQLRTTGLPAAVENSGVCENVRILTRPTVKVALAVAVAVPLTAVSVYVVVDVEFYGIILCRYCVSSAIGHSGQEDDYGSIDVFAEVPNPRVPKEMLELAKHILETKAGHFDPKRFKDDYELALRKLVKRKAAGEKIIAGWMDGSYNVYNGPIKDQAGVEKVAAGKSLSYGDILGLNWLVEGVEGKLT